MSDTVRVHFVAHEQTVEAEVGESILEIAERNGIELDHACGGVCACSTCHIKITSGASLLNESSEDEEDQLDNARDVNLESRLGCQARIMRAPTGDEVIDIAIPAWNVNLVQEPH